jgi:hypothetical protein
MDSIGDPEKVVAWLGLGAIAAAGFYRLVVWVRAAPVRPDPWDEETERQLHEPGAVEVCHRCFRPQPPEAWFCGHCGSAVGPYNNCMPFLNLFSEGEVYRNGVSDRLRPTPLIIGGYLLMSLYSYNLFAPLYWFYLFKNLFRKHEDIPAPAGAGSAPPEVPPA